MGEKALSARVPTHRLACRCGHPVQRTWKRVNELLLVLYHIFLRKISGFFNCHIVKLFRIKDFTTFQALDVLRVFVSGNDSYPGMFAGGRHRIVFRGIRMLFPPIVAAFLLNSSVKIAFLPSFPDSDLSQSPLEPR
jgi:hypothetical protein